VRIKELTISYAETRSYGDHHNVSPRVTLTADIDNDTGEAAVLLTQKAIEQVREIIDDTLEANNEPAYYSTDPRYQVMYSPRRHLVILLPNTLDIDPPKDFTISYSVPRGFRYEAAITAAQHLAYFQLHGPYTVRELPDADFSKLPPLPQDPAQPAGGDEDDEDDEPYFVGGDIEPDFSVIAIPA